MKTKQLEAILKPPSVVFDEESHTYTTKTGELYTGCTTISDAWDKSFFLGPWYAKEMALEILSKPFDEVSKFTPPEFEKFVMDCKGAAKRKSELAKVNGTLAHDWIGSAICKKIDANAKILPMPKDGEAKSAIDAFVAWAKGKNIQWLASEEVVSSDEFRIGGKLDAIAVIDGITYLVDFKTSGQLSASYLLQCAGYDVMLREMGLQVMGYMIVRIPKDGKEVETLTITNREDMQFFRETFLKQREAHKFYVFMESKFKDQQTGKMKVDAKVEAPEIKSIKQNEHSKKSVGKSASVGKGKGTGRVSAPRAKK